MRTHLQKRIAEIKSMKLAKVHERRYIAQIKRRGWSNQDLWSLESHLANYMLPMLKELFSWKSGVPCNLTDAQWTETQGKIIYALERYAKDDIFDIASAASDWKTHKYKSDEERNKDYRAKFNELRNKIDEGMQLFGKYFGHLWS